MANPLNNNLCPICKKTQDRCKCDLQIKFGSKEEAKWNEILEQSEAAAVSNKVSLEINELLVNHAKKRIAEEKDKFK